MSAAVATRRPAKAAKKTYKPHIRIVNRAAGLYTVQSERYTHVLYLVDVVTRTCECEGSAKWGSTCKHLKFVTVWHEAIERSRQAKMAPAVSVASPALVSRYGGAAGLMDAFGVAS